MDRNFVFKLDSFQHIDGNTIFCCVYIRVNHSNKIIAAVIQILVTIFKGERLTIFELADICPCLEYLDLIYLRFFGISFKLVHRASFFSAAIPT